MFLIEISALTLNGLVRTNASEIIHTLIRSCIQSALHFVSTKAREFLHSLAEVESILLSHWLHLFGFSPLSVTAAVASYQNPRIQLFKIKPSRDIHTWAVA